jgi:hypothetical protein
LTYRKAGTAEWKLEDADQDPQNDGDAVGNNRAYEGPVNDEAQAESMRDVVAVATNYGRGSGGSTSIAVQKLQRQGKMETRVAAVGDYSRKSEGCQADHEEHVDDPEPTSICFEFSLLPFFHNVAIPRQLCPPTTLTKQTLHT